MDMLARYSEEAIQAAEDNNEQYCPDVPGLAYFCDKAIGLNKASEILLQKVADQLTAAAGRKELRKIARRPDTLPFPIGLRRSLEKLDWPENVESVCIGTKTIYTAASGPRRKTKFARETSRSSTRKQANKPCPVCGFATNPGHDARKHRAQGDKKRPFTSKQLKELGLVKW